MLAGLSRPVGPRTLAQFGGAVVDASTSVADGATGARTAVDAWRTTNGIPTGIGNARTGQAELLLAAAGDTTAPGQWTELAELLDDPLVARELDLSSRRFVNGDPATVARRIGAGTWPASAWPSEQHAFAAQERQARRWLGVFGLSDSTPADRAAALDTLLQRPIESLTGTDWARTAALAMDAPTREALGPGLGSWRMLVDRADAHARGLDAPGSVTGSIFRQYALERMPLEERVGRIHDLLRRSPDTLSRADWTDIKLLMGDRNLQAAAKLSDSFPGASWSLSQFAGFHAGGEALGVGTRAYFERAIHAGRPLEHRANEVRELLMRHPLELASRDWLRVSVLSDDPAVRKAVETPVYEFGGTPDPQKFVKLALQTSSRHPHVPEQLRRMVIDWQSRHDPAFESRVAAAVVDVVNGRADARAHRTLADVGERLPLLVRGHSPDEQARIAEAVLAGTDAPLPTRTGSILAPIQANLDELRRRLDGLAVHSQAKSLITETKTLVDRNLQRIGNRTPDGAVRGYLNYPDYAEIGRIRSNVSLIRAIIEESGPRSESANLLW